MKVFIPAYFITSGHSVQKWKGTDMESMRDTKRIMEREIKKGSTPLSFEQMEIDTNNYQEITSVEKLTQVLQYLHRVGNYKSLAGKTVINNVYTFMRGRTPDFTRARSIFDREKIYHQMLRQERKMRPTYEGDCYIETAKCYFSLPEEWEKHKMIYLNNDAYGFILSNKYILGLYKYCREARRDIAMEAHEIPENTNTVVQHDFQVRNFFSKHSFSAIMGISLLCLEEMNMCDENMNLEEQVTEPVEPKVETEPLFEEMVDFDTFSKSDFRVVKVKECSAVKKSKKLLHFVLDDGTGTDRIILSGIHAYYEPEELVGKTLLAITNLPPRSMMGIDSCGMLLSAVHTVNGEEKLNLVMLDDAIPAGAKLY